MPVQFDLESVPDVAVGVGEGDLTLTEMKEAALGLWRQVTGPQVRILWDLRQARFDLKPDEVRSLAEFVKGAAPSVDLRSAFVVSRDLEFGLVRMFEVFRETPSAHTAVFRNREEALGWLRDASEG